jgi:hypothetical protein
MVSSKASTLFRTLLFKQAAYQKMSLHQRILHIMDPQFHQTTILWGLMSPIDHLIVKLYACLNSLGEEEVDVGQA